MVDYLWTIALGIEDGDLSLAAQALRDAQEALRKALENGASDEEIQRLTENLRQAMQQFLQALADEAQQNPQANNLPPNANVQTLRQQDLERMLDRSRTWRAPAPATPPARCSPNCRTCWRTCRPAGRSRATSRTARRCRASTSSAT